MKRFRLHLHANRRCSPSGFTLLELILSLGLSSLLLAAVYTALQLHWSSSALGHVEMERSQVARALFRRMETDLRSVVFRDTALSSSTDDGSSSSSSGTSSSSTGTSGASGSTGSGGSSTSGTTGSSSNTGDSSTGTTTTTDVYSTQKSGLFGDSESVLVHLSLPSRATTLAANGGAASSSGSDLQSVAYFLAGSGSGLASQFSGSGSQARGLSRLQGDRMAMQAADESGSLSSMAANVQLLAPEVASILFEYFDGVTWSTSWDSGTSNSIPNAIRITIDFHPPANTHGWYSRPVSKSTDRFQHTVALPLAQPYVSSAQ